METASAKTKPQISIIIPTFNSMRYLKDCLDSLRAAMARYGNAELILMDNGSKDGTHEYLLSNFGSAAKVCRIEGVTIAALRNCGAEQAKGEFLSFIDSDCVIPAEYFDQAVEVFNSVRTDATGNYYDLPPNSGWVQDTWFNLNRRTTDKYVPYLFTGNLIVKADVFRALGGFDERLTTGEDAEFGLRLNKAGYKMFATAEVPALHLGIQRNLREFYEKNTWHGLGMFGSLKKSWLDKPLLMTFAHLLLSAGGIANLFFTYMRLPERIALVLLLPFAVPASAALYRMAKGKRFYRPFRATLLYFVFFASRLHALLLLTSASASGRAAPKRAVQKS